jgi:hypothetical protein
MCEHLWHLTVSALCVNSGDRNPLLNAEPLTRSSKDFVKHAGRLAAFTRFLRSMAFSNIHIVEHLDFTDGCKVRVGY